MFSETHITHTEVSPLAWFTGRVTLLLLSPLFSVGRECLLLYRAFSTITPFGCKKFAPDVVSTVVPGSVSYNYTEEDPCSGERNVTFYTIPNTILSQFGKRTSTYLSFTIKLGHQSFHLWLKLSWCILS